MPLWFEIAVLIFLGLIALALIDLCFAMENVTRNMSNFGIRFEEEILPRLETAIRGNSDTTLSDD
jgi:hypothetical protein